MMYKGYQVNLEFRTFYKRNKRNGMEGWMEVMFKYQKWRLKKVLYACPFKNMG